MEPVEIFLRDGEIRSLPARVWRGGGGLHRLFQIIEVVGHA
ncbi:hypothetical protein [Roseovarius sp.]|nr:hypothetical protein [Roseovarius sp.]MDM8166111.1 hypothetical protein [Roseovarius sp.]